MCRFKKVSSYGLCTVEYYYYCHPDSCYPPPTAFPIILPHKFSTTPTPSPSSMSSTAASTSSSNFQLIAKALSDYVEQTGIDLTRDPFADKLQNCDSADSIFQLLQDRANRFKTYREEHRKLINCLNPVLQFLHVFSGTLGESLILVSSSESIRLFRL